MRRISGTQNGLIDADDASGAPPCYKNRPWTFEPLFSEHSMSNMNFRRSASAVLALACGLAVSAPASAEELMDGPLQFRAQIYGWFPSISGTTAFPPPATGSASVNVDMGDVLSSLNFAFMGTLEMRKGRVGLLTDYIYLNMDATKSATRDLTLTGPGGRIELPVGATADVNVELKGWAWTLAGTYAAIETPTYQLDVLAGTRLLKID